MLCARIQQLLERQGELVPLSCPQEVERDAQRIAAQLLNRAPPAAVERPDLQTVDVSSLELIRPRSVGVENVGLWAMEQLGLEALLERLGFNGTQFISALAMLATIGCDKYAFKSGHCMNKRARSATNWRLGAVEALKPPTIGIGRIRAPTPGHG